jgi:hypothetical protein
MSLSDAELLAEIEAEGLDPEKEAVRLRTMVGAATAQSGKARLVAARAEIARSAKSARSNIHLLPLQERAAVLARFANDDSKLKSRLTMAARNGNGITEQEMNSILADLRELGAIDEDGNPV